VRARINIKFPPAKTFLEPCLAYFRLAEETDMPATTWGQNRERDVSDNLSFFLLSLNYQLLSSLKQTHARRSIDAQIFFSFLSHRSKMPRQHLVHSSCPGMLVATSPAAQKMEPFKPVFAFAAKPHVFFRCILFPVLHLCLGIGVP
jgi:hypothetical protein